MKLKKPSEFTIFITTSMFLLLCALFCFYKAYTITKHIEQQSHRKCIKIDIRPDYTLELISQDSVLIQSGKIIYKCHFNDIQKVIEKDNL